MNLDLYSVGDLYHFIKMVRGIYMVCLSVYVAIDETELQYCCYCRNQIALITILLTRVPAGLSLMDRAESERFTMGSETQNVILDDQRVHFMV